MKVDVGTVSLQLLLLLVLLLLLLLLLLILVLLPRFGAVVENYVVISRCKLKGAN